MEQKTEGISEVARLRAVYESSKAGAVVAPDDIAWLILLYQEAATAANNLRGEVQQLAGMLADNNKNCDRMAAQIKGLEYDVLKLRNKHSDVKKIMIELANCRKWFGFRKEVRKTLSKYEEIRNYINDAMTRELTSGL